MTSSLRRQELYIERLFGKMTHGQNEPTSDIKTSK